MRKPTLQEQADAWRHLAFSLNMHRTITMNHESVVQCLNRIDRWVGAHSTHNGERPEAEVDKNVNHAFWTHIALMEPPPLPKRGRPPKDKDASEE